mmetsp:Transcript_66652/g.130724  ORF Transcript_66652/g.130724 Transcript_66652/m.130724 type:complete len:201 (-) Transcript_66652:392-994(-)
MPLGAPLPPVLPPLVGGGGGSSGGGAGKPVILGLMPGPPPALCWHKGHVACLSPLNFFTDSTQATWNSWPHGKAQACSLLRSSRQMGHSSTSQRPSRSSSMLSPSAAAPFFSDRGSLWPFWISGGSEAGLRAPQLLQLLRRAQLTLLQPRHSQSSGDASCAAVAPPPPWSDLAAAEEEGTAVLSDVEDFFVFVVPECLTK